VNRLWMMRLAGIRDVDYETLMVVSGYATSFAYHPLKYGALYQPPTHRMPPMPVWQRLPVSAACGCRKSRTRRKDGNW